MSARDSRPDDDALDEPLTALLARRAREGDMSRFDELYERLMPALSSWAHLRVTPTARGRIEVEELLQETWVRALRNFDSFDERTAPFRRWIFGIAKNVLLEALHRAQSGARELGGPTTRLFALEAIPDSVTTVAARVARDDTLQRFLAHVRELGEDEATLVVLCGLEGWSSKDAALRLGISEEATKKRWQRLRAELGSQSLPRDLLADE